VRPLVCAAALLASLAAVGLAAPKGEARTAVPGDGCLVISQGFGNVTVSLTRGLIFGRVGSISAITVEDPVLSDPTPPVVYGYGSKTLLPDGRIRYTGNQSNAPLRFKSQGALKIRISDATLLDLSVVGRGYAVLSSGGFTPDTANLYSVDATSFCQDNFEPIPPTGTKPVKVSISSPTS
jgi:hypothetical protein